MRKPFIFICISVLCVAALSLLAGVSLAQDAEGEWQLTFSPISKLLDNNDSFSRDDRFLVYDTRETFGGGIGNGTMIMKVSISTGLENFVYAPWPVLIGSQAAPGLGAASYSPVDDVVVFIHGPLVSETAKLGFYGGTNRRGGVARADGSGDVGYLDCRDVQSEPTPPGAHRGGSHRHEFSADGSRIGFTYDDALLTQYGRNIGYMVSHEKAPCGVSFYAALLAPVVPAAESKPGDLERAADDSWVGAKGLMRAFIGNVKEADGKVMGSLFVVDIPENVDITTAGSGTKTVYPSPPVGTRVRRLTTTPAGGIVRGSLDGTRIGYFANAADGSRQAFIINAQGSDQHQDPAMRPVQVTTFEKGATGGLRWHPSGNSIAVISDGGVAAVCVKPGPLFGKTAWLTPRGAQIPAADALVWSHNGKLLAYNRRVPTYNAAGALVKDSGGNDFRQIFLVRFPDKDGNGIADSVE
ncbi:MAG: DUF3748 domain-containing protein [Candidatus Solibacter usitatus]|nr:DUF3748 domain-containing protein [Candidatus Solibacter usitatus]